MIDSVPEYVASAWYAANIVACLGCAEKCRENIRRMRVAGMMLDSMSRELSMCDRGIRFRHARRYAMTWGSLAFAIATGNFLGLILYQLFGH